MNAASPRYEVRYDEARRLLRWTMRGFWTLEDVAGFAAAMRAAVEKLGPPPVDVDGLSDARAFPVQSKEVAGALSQINDIGRKMRTGRTAIVVGSMMNKLQAQHTLAGPGLKIFLSIDDAMDWLATPATDQP